MKKRDNDTENTTENDAVGTAYAFFDCPADYNTIARSMLEIRQDAQTPNELELQLYEGNAELEFDEELTENLQYPGDYRRMPSAQLKEEHEPEKRPLGSMKYTLVATYPKSTNEDTAKQLGDVVRTIDCMFNAQPIFTGAVVYEKDGEYCTLEE